MNIERRIFMKKINEIAELTGLTTRALRYYDEVGLLKPSEISESGYRLYDDTALEVLQQILFFKELDVPLKQIKSILENPSFDRISMLKKHKKLITLKRDRLNKILALINKNLRGEKCMSFTEFDISEVKKCQKIYENEAKELYKDTEAFAEYQKKTSKYNDSQWDSINREMLSIFEQFAEVMDKEPCSQEAQILVEKWKNYITQNFYECTDEILAGLGQMYVQDERFKKNIDKHQDGLAEFISDAIKCYCEHR